MAGGTGGLIGSGGRGVGGWPASGGVDGLAGGIAAGGSAGDGTGNSPGAGGANGIGGRGAWGIGGRGAGGASGDGPTGGSPVSGGFENSAGDAGSGTGVAGSPDAGGAGGAVGQRIAIPIYIHPSEGDAWARVHAAGSKISYLIINAGDPGGPGESRDRAYTTAIADAHEVGQRVVGYVDTAYAERPLSEVIADIEAWYEYYPAIDGCFLDQTPAAGDQIPTYFEPAAELIRSQSGPHVVIINPGQPEIDEGFMDVADVVMSFECPYDYPDCNYSPGRYTPSPWMASYPPDRFWHIVLEVSDAPSMLEVLELSRDRGAGHVYITNYPDPPAYSRLPTYLDAELAAIEP